MDKTVKLWDLKTYSVETTLIGHTDGVFSVSFSPDGNKLSSGSWNKTIKIWDLKTYFVEANL
jgi:WD40 repeat protein